MTIVGDDWWKKRVFWPALRHSKATPWCCSNEPLAVDAIVLVNVGFLFQSVSLVGSVQSATPEVVDSSRKKNYLFHPTVSIDRTLRWKTSLTGLLVKPLSRKGRL
ncbi:hypothetical protein pipiens_009509 [Culex pipiens pipiens]|uniref:Uncharacterized protein n=1 Tax=Culex pipiens pipiens TaxID=38569 RepID=A0ABD1DDY7_CULPP